MALEPTSVQRDRMLANGKSRLSLVQFLNLKDPERAQEYFSDTCRFIVAEKGSRDHQLVIDQSITIGDFPYQYLVVDSFPSSQALLLAHEKTREIRLASLVSSFSILVQPNLWMPRIAKGLGFLQSTFTRLLGTTEIKTLRESSDDLNPMTDPDLGKVKEFGSGAQDQSFFMMNLNQFSVDGKRLYNQYSTLITPYLVSVGGYPDIYGKILGTYIGDQKDPLFTSWHEFALVYYPSRTSFLRLMTNTPRGAAEVRREGLKKVVLMAALDIQTKEYLA